MIPFVGVVRVERTPTFPSLDRLVVLVMATGGFVIGWDIENSWIVVF